MTSSASLTSDVGCLTGDPVGIGLRILVVDDHHDAADSLSDVLRLIGHRARTAYDGPSALTAARQWRPHVAILDLGLPGMDGYEVARRIRGEPWAERILLIALTGWAGDDYRRRAMEAGFDRYDIKPIAIGLLIAAIGRFAAVAG